MMKDVPGSTGGGGKDDERCGQEILEEIARWYSRMWQGGTG